MSTRPFMATSWRRRAPEEDQSRNGSPRAIPEQRQLAAGNRIYVGNMPYMAQRQDVAKLFADEGIELANIDISIDPFTSRNPSFCFVDLVKPEDAQKVLNAFPGKMFCGRPLKVNSCVQKRPANTRPYSSLLETSRYRSSPRELTVERTEDHQRGHSQHGLGSIPLSTPTGDLLVPIQEKRRLFVGGLRKPADNHRSDLLIRELFKGFDVDAVSKFKWPRSDLLPGNAWYAFVDLKTAEQAQRAMKQLNGMPMWDSNITVNLAEGSPTKVLETIAKEEEEAEKRGAAAGSK